MKFSLASIALFAGLATSGIALAQAPAGAPAGSTAMCKDGSYTSHATKKGACAGHKGVKDWFGAAPGAAAPAAATPAAAAMPAAGSKPTAVERAPATAKVAAPTATAAPGGGAGAGAGKVWVNTPSKVYHCPGTKYYGKTKQGEYMTEGAAKAAGDRAEHGKACS